MRKRIKRAGGKLLAAVLTASLLGGCAVSGGPDGSAAGASGAQTQQGGTDAPSGQETAASVETDSEKQESELVSRSTNLYFAERASLISAPKQSEAASVTPCAESYTVAADLSNIDNLWQFGGIREGEFTEKLVQNGFVVAGDAGREFFEIYETNRYNLIPNFVTVDSLMHTYHLYFSHLLRKIEKEHLCAALTELSGRMLENSLAQYEQLKGTEWEEAAKRNAAYFTVGAKLLDDDTAVHEDVEQVVSQELTKISRGEGIDVCGILGDEGDMEDYTQYIPRGYYEGDEELERYFRAMMWYGRIHFKQESEELDRSALLMTKALADDEEAAGLWEAVYTITSFFAGASDDLSVYEYAPLIQQIYGESISSGELAGDEKRFAEFHAATAGLPAPRIHSVPVYEWEENQITGFRFMGQRFTIDAEIMQNLIYRSVEENSAGERRMLPDMLDVPAALGSDAALGILEESGDTEYAGYTENMNQLRESLANEDDRLWSASLYSSWLYTLRPLLDRKGEGYPTFMQNEEWAKKDLECFAGSFTELKHDTVLYSKQVIAEMGGGYDEEPDDRGYVEPEPFVYERFVNLADMTAQGLERYGMLAEEEKENLSRLSQIAGQLLTISEKELRDELLTDEEYDFIRGYGGNIEHFWYEASRDIAQEDYIATKECPAAIVTDIATDPNGTVLEAATGNPSTIWVVVRVDGKLKIAWGSVYSFYQFEQPIAERLTDAEWRQMLGIQAGEDGYYRYDEKPERPAWTASYRYEYD